MVEISPNAEPPVCKLMDYGKFLYQQKKRDKELKAKLVEYRKEMKEKFIAENGEGVDL